MDGSTNARVLRNRRTKLMHLNQSRSIFLKLLITFTLITLSITSVSGQLSDNQITSLVWSNDGQKVASGDHGGHVTIHDISAGTNIEFQAHSLNARVAWSPNDQRLATVGSEDKVLRIWDTDTGQLISEVSLDAPNLGVIRWRPDGNMILIAPMENDTFAVSANLTTDEYVVQSRPYNVGTITDFDWIPNQNDPFITVSGFIFWGDQTLGPSSVDRNSPRLRKIDISRDDSIIAGAFTNGMVGGWDIITNTEMFNLSANNYNGDDIRQRFVHDVRFSPTDDLIITVSGDGTVRTWDTNTLDIVSEEQLPSPIHATAISPDGAQIAYATYDTQAIEFRQLNEVPLANASADQTILDSDNNGSESVTLDGSGSNDPDGTIVTYSWSESNIEIAIGVNPQVTLPIGEHTITLTVTDDDGATRTDDVIITITGDSAAQAVTGFTLVDATTEQDIAPLTDGMQIDLAATPSINIRANTSPATVGSVRFGLDGNPFHRTETVAPYASHGDNGGNYYGWTPELGAHELTATPFNGSGDAGTSLTVDFTVIDSSLGDAVISYTLIDAQNDVIIDEMYDGYLIDYDAIGTNQINIVANTNPATVGSVVFSLDGDPNTRTENVAPYSLDGDDSGDYFSWTPTIGGYHLVATPYSGGGGGGTAGAALEMGFVVYDSSDCTYFADNPTELTDAITQANGTPQADTICLTQDKFYNLDTVAETNDGPNGLPAITSDITILGNGAIIRRLDGSPDFRFVRVNSGAQLELQNLTLRNGATSAHGGAIRVDGTLALSFVTLEDNQSGSSGGAIHNAGGTLDIANSTFENNQTTGTSFQNGGAIDNTGTVTITFSSFINNVNSASSATATGGAIRNFSSAASLTVLNSTFIGNVSSNDGGAIENTGGTLLVRDSEFRDNHTIGVADYREGGAIFSNTTLPVEITRSVFIDNYTSPDSNNSDGGAVFLNGSGSTFTITDSLFEGNTVYDDGGALAIRNNTIVDINNTEFINNTTTATDDYRNGGAIHLADADVTIADSTFTGNNTSSSGYGGAISSWGDDSVVDVNGSVFTSNSSGRSGGAISVDSTNGDAVLNIHTSTFQDNVASNDGGAIRSLHSNLLVIDSVFTGNQTTGVDYSNGGAIYCVDATASITNSTFQNNAASDSTISTNSDGGAILYAGAVGSMTITGGTFSNNTSPDDGGAIINRNNATLIIQGVTFDGNHTTGTTYSDGGTLRNEGGSHIQITNTTFTNNYTNPVSPNSDAGVLANSGTGTTADIINSMFTGNYTNDDGGVFSNWGGATLDISGSTFTGNYVTSDAGVLWNVGATATIANSSFDGNHTTGTEYDDGGAIVNTSGGTITISNSDFTGNYTSTNSTQARGGAIVNTGAGTQLTISGTLFDGNTAPSNGGAILNDSGANLTIQTLSRFENNSTITDGGAIYNAQGSVAAITDSTFLNNSAEDGGAIRNSGSNNPSLTVQNTIFEGNQSSRDGGAIVNYDTGISNIQNSEFINNVAGRFSGAVHLDMGYVDITASCFSGNTGTSEAIRASFNANIVDAQGNWWGDASGPTHSGNPGGIGETVTGGVDYANWITSSTCDPQLVGAGSGAMMASAPAQPEFSLVQPGFAVVAPNLNLQDNTSSDISLALPDNRTVLSTPLLDTFDEDTTIGWRVTNSWELSLAESPQDTAFRADVGQFGGEFILEATPAISLDSQPTLTFMQQGTLATGESISVEVQVNGVGDWIVVDTQDGLDTIWQERQVDLSAYAGQTLTLRFRIVSHIRDEETATTATYWLDDVAID